MYIKPLFIVMVSLFFSQQVMATNKQPTYESVLTPGARLVAGDLSKNEFFILGKDEPRPAIGPKKAPVVEIAALNKKETPKIIEKVKAAVEVAIRKPANKRPQPEIDVYKAYAANSNIPLHRVKAAFAENKVSAKPVNKKITVKTAAYKIKKSVIYQSPVKAGSKKKIANVKTVLKKEPRKLTRKKVTSRVAMLNQKKQKAKTNKAVIVKA